MNTMPCKGICHRYKADKKFGVNGRYEHGQKRCSTCDIFMNWNGNHCPCCGYMLRIRPRVSKNREKLMVVRQIKRI